MPEGVDGNAPPPVAPGGSTNRADAASPANADAEAAIEACVRLFYAKAHADPLLEPVMTASITDFERHVTIVCAFWSRALLGTERYVGKAYPAHVGLPIRPEHFERWLDLFAEAAATLPAGHATVAIDKAEQMAKSFMAGLFPAEPLQIRLGRAASGSGPQSSAGTQQVRTQRP